MMSLVRCNRFEVNFQKPQHGSSTPLFLRRQHAHPVRQVAVPPIEGGQR